MDCQPGMQPVYRVSDSTSSGLLAWVAASLYYNRTVPTGTVGQGYSQFIWCPNPLPGDCRPGVQPAVLIVLNLWFGPSLSERIGSNIYIFGTCKSWLEGEELDTVFED